MACEDAPCCGCCGVDDADDNADQVYDGFYEENADDEQEE